MEQDPNGKSTKELGCKLDSGKPPLGQTFRQFSKALQEIGRLDQYGASKYSQTNWYHVPDGINRYTDAMFRHMMKHLEGELLDDSGFYHLTHACWNMLAILELELREGK